MIDTRRPRHTHSYRPPGAARRWLRGAKGGGRGSSSPRVGSNRVPAGGAGEADISEALSEVLGVVEDTADLLDACEDEEIQAAAAQAASASGSAETMDLEADFGTVRRDTLAAEEIVDGVVDRTLQRAPSKRKAWLLS